MRARNLKPSFFKNEDLAKCSFPARLLFSGLWCLADRDGKLEERPLRIKAELFPFDQVDVVSLLSELEAANTADPLIIRYVVDGKRYIKIPSFRKHASPHYTEKASEIPDCEPFQKSSGELTVALPPESPFLNPESRIMNTEILRSAKPPSPPQKAPSPKQLVELWNELADPALPRCRVVSWDTDDRVKKARQRLVENPDKQFWIDVIKRVNDSKFCKGVNDRNWRLDFAFLVNSSKNIGKILEGKYDDRQPSNGVTQIAVAR